MTHRLASCTEISRDRLRGSAAELHDQGWRLITASGIPRGDGAYTVLYHFEKQDRLRHLRVELAAGEPLPSIGSICRGASLVENEMIELQGVPVVDLAVDYRGRLYRDFDRLEGWVHDDRGAEAPDGPLQVAAALRLDACVPVDQDGREVRAPGSRVSAESTEGPGRADAAPDRPAGGA